MADIYGRPPTASEELLIKAAEALGPDKSLANLDAAAKLILSNVVLVAAVLTGFGLFTDVATRLREQPELFGAAVSLAILSAVLALAALIPIPGRVDVDDLQSIHDRFRALSIGRGVLVALATLFLLLAIGVAARGALLYLGESGPTDPAITISRSIVVGESAPVLSATVTQARAPSGAQATLLISAPSAGVIHRATQVVGSSGDVSLAATVAKSPRETFTLVYTLRTPDGGLIEKRVDLE
jgi:hypothetical protein